MKNGKSKAMKLQILKPYLAIVEDFYYTIIGND